MNEAYPAPPWTTHGDARFVAYLVDASAVRPPPGLRLLSRAGRSVGLLGYVHYRAPSPLTYRELLWMPARVEAVGADGRRSRGWYVAKMLVDDERSLVAGRELWALPKELADFETRGAEVVTRAGAATVRWRSRARFGVRGRGTVLSLQRRGPELVRFKGEFEGRVAPARCRVEFEGLDRSWQGLERAIPLGPFGTELRAFVARMLPPRATVLG